MVGMCVCQNKIVYFFNVKSIKICGNFIVCVYISGINQDSLTAAGYKLTISLTDVQIAYHKRICVCTRSLIHSGITVNRTPSRKYLSREYVITTETINKTAIIANINICFLFVFLLFAISVVTIFTVRLFCFGLLCSGARLYKAIASEAD